MDHGGDEVDPARRGDPGDAAHHALADGIAGVLEAAPVRVAVLEADRDQGVGGVLLQRGLGQAFDEQGLRPRLFEPAQRHRGRTAVDRLVLAQRGQEMVHEVSAPQGGLHRGIEAVAGGGGTLLDGDHGMDGHVAQRYVGIVEVGHQMDQGLPAGEPAERLDHRGAQELVAEQVQQRSLRPRVADLAQGVDGRVLEPGLGPQHVDERDHRLRRTDLAQAGGGGVAHVDVRVAQGGDEGGDGRALAAGPEHDRGEVAHLLVLVGQEGEEGGGGRRPHLHVDLHGRVAHGRILVVAQRRLEMREERRLVEGGQQLRGRLPHGPALVRDRQQQGRDGFGLPRPAELVDDPPANGLLAGAEMLQCGLDVDHVRVMGIHRASLRPQPGPRAPWEAARRLAGPAAR